MPAKSKKQQNLFGMVYAEQMGKIKGASDQVKKMAKVIKPKTVAHFASTPTTNLPKAVKRRPKGPSESHFGDTFSMSKPKIKKPRGGV